MINTGGSSSEEGGFGQAHWGLPAVGSIMGGCQGDLQFWGIELGNPFSLPHWADPAPSPYPMKGEKNPALQVLSQPGPSAPRYYGDHRCETPHPSWSFLPDPWTLSSFPLPPQDPCPDAKLLHQHSLWVPAGPHLLQTQCYNWQSEPNARGSRLPAY